MFSTSSAKRSFSFIDDGVVVETPSETIENDQGRWYKFTDGRCYPSVTTVLSRYKAAGLQEWIDRTPEAERTAILNKASARGTALHEAVEGYLTGNQKDIMPDTRERLVAVKPLLHRINNIRANERFYFSDKYKVAGRTDCIADFDGILSVIDFKTARRPKDESHITNYFEQETLYGEMFYQHHGLQPLQIVTIIAIDQSPKPQLFLKNPADYRDSAMEKIRNFK